MPVWALQLPMETRRSVRASWARRANSVTRAVLPEPASPVTNTTWLWPARVRSRNVWSWFSSRWRATNTCSVIAHLLLFGWLCFCNTAHLHAKARRDCLGRNPLVVQLSLQEHSSRLKRSEPAIAYHQRPHAGVLAPSCSLTSGSHSLTR